MKRSSGMGIEMPKWVITTKTKKKIWSIKQNKFINELKVECLFDSSVEANEKLKDLDFGYVVEKVSHYLDIENEYVNF